MNNQKIMKENNQVQIIKPKIISLIQGIELKVEISVTISPEYEQQTRVKIFLLFWDENSS